MTEGSPRPEHDWTLRTMVMFVVLLVLLYFIWRDTISPSTGPVFRYGVVLVAAFFAWVIQVMFPAGWGLLELAVAMYAAWKGVSSEISSNPTANSLLVIGAIYVMSKGFQTCLEALRKKPPTV